MKPISEYVTIREAASITGYSHHTILYWCRNGSIKYAFNRSDHQDRLRPNIKSLLAFMNERAEGAVIPKCPPIPPRHIDPGIEACMNDTQRQAHEFLVSHPEMIECRRGGRLLLSACQAYVRRNYGLVRCVGCIGCEQHHKPKVLPKADQKEGFQFVTRSQMDSRADMRDFHRQAPQLFAAKETKERNIKEKRGEAAKRKSRERMEATKQNLQRDANIRRAKRLYKDGFGKTYRELAKILGVSKTTCERWVTGKEFR